MAVSFRSIPEAMTSTISDRDCGICLEAFTTVNTLTNPNTRESLRVEVLTGDPVAHDGKDGEKHPFHAACAAREIARQRWLGQNPKCPTCKISVNGINGIDANQIAQRIREEDEGSLATVFFKHAAVGAIATAMAIAYGAAATFHLAETEGIGVGEATRVVGAAVGGRVGVLGAARAGVATSIVVGAVGAVVGAVAAGAAGAVNIASKGIGDAGIAGMITGVAVHVALKQFQLNERAVCSGVGVGGFSATAVAVMGFSVPVIAAMGIGVAGMAAGSLAVYQRLRR